MNVKAVGAEKQITLSWQNPATSTTSWIRTVIVRKEGVFPSSPSDGTIVFQGTENEYTDINLGNGKTYRYAFYTIDRANTYSAAVIIEASPVQGKSAIERPASVVAASPVQQQGVQPQGSLPTIRLTRTLARGSRNPDVKMLQQFLIAKNYLAPGNTTGFFGILTESALKKFQCDQKIICKGTPSGGWGVVGLRTRGIINQILGTTTPPTSPPATIDTISLLREQLRILQEQLKALQGR